MSLLCARCVTPYGADHLLDDLGNTTGADGTATFADCEAEALVHGDGLDELNGHLAVVARHNHLGAFGELHNTGHVSGTEVELRTVVVEERGVAAALVLGQDVDGTLEVGVRGVGAGGADTLAALDVLALVTTEDEGDVFASFAVIEHLAEHLDTGNGGGGGLVADTDELDILVEVDNTALDTAGDNGATTGDGEDVLNGHEEGLVGFTNRIRNGFVNGVHELEDGVRPLLVALQSLVGGNADDRSVLVVFLGSEQFANFHLDELEDFLIVNHVALVESDDDVGDTHLAGKEHVLTGLRHRAVGGGDHEDGTVHLSSTGDHVLDVVSVTGGVDVCVVTLLGLVLHVGDVDGNTTGLLFRGLVDLIEREGSVEIGVLLREHLGDSCGQGGLAMVDVTDGANVYVRLGPLELSLRHFVVLLDDHEILAGASNSCLVQIFGQMLLG